MKNMKNNIAKAAKYHGVSDVGDFIEPEHAVAKKRKIATSTSASRGTSRRSTYNQAETRQQHTALK
jgi:hypothetical protein